MIWWWPNRLDSAHLCTYNLNWHFNSNKKYYFITLNALWHVWKCAIEEINSEMELVPTYFHSKSFRWKWIVWGWLCEVLFKGANKEMGKNYCKLQFYENKKLPGIWSMILSSFFEFGILSCFQLLFQLFDTLWGTFLMALVPMYAEGRFQVRRLKSIPRRSHARVQLLFECPYCIGKLVTE